MSRNLIYCGIGFGLFCIGYLLINQQILVQSILYRAAAADHASALIAIAAMAIQASALLVAMTVFANKLFWITLILVALSASINVIFSQILNDTIDLARFDWMLTEARHAGNAAGLFWQPTVIALGKICAALGCFVACRRLLCPILQQFIGWPDRPAGQTLATLAFVAPTLVFAVNGPGVIAAERNIYHFTYQHFTMPPPPDRELVTIDRANDREPIEKILWIIDESIGYDAFARLIKPGLSDFAPIDFGKTSAMANCSAPAHVALRSGVDVLTVNSSTDLRRTPSIWGYAGKAGYRTILIDGQISGPPQNLLMAPELELIDEMEAAASGIRTDLAIAANLNARLKNGGKQFIYAVLRGVHFQYTDHYPADEQSADDSLKQQYANSISYSKRGFFNELLDGIDREKVAIVYTSDHGQNVKKGVVPHCATAPEKEEFAVPLLAFLPRSDGAALATRNDMRHSASQIFPTTLTWMGYDPAAVSQRYDNILERPPKTFIWFGRAVVPLHPDDRINVTKTEQSLVD